MNRFILGFGLCVLLTVSTALGNPVININTQYMLNTNAERQIPILVSSSPTEQVEGLVLAVQIGDGGSVNSGVNTSPRITNLDIIGSGTIFNASNTGSTPVYLSADENPPYLIAQADTTTASGSLDANGVLAYLTVNPSGASVGSYQVKLQNVGENVDGGPWNTDFAGSPADFAGNFYIQVVNLHQSIWNAGQNGNWTDATWTSSAPPVPNYTTQAIVNTSYTVDVTSAQAADSLALSGGGKVAISSSGSLVITNNATVSTGGTLSIASGAGLNAAGIQLSGGTISGNGTIAPTVTLSGGTLDAPLSGDNLVVSQALSGVGGLNKTGNGTVTLTGNATYSGSTTIAAGVLQVNGANSALDDISGAGALTVGDDSTPSVLTVNSLILGKLRIGAGSKLMLNASASGPLAGSDSVESVPEPATITLLIAVALGMLLFFNRRMCR